MEEECLKQSLLDPVAETSPNTSYTNCSFVISNEMRTNNNFSKSNKNMMRVTPSCVRFREDYMDNKLINEEVKEILEKESSPVKFELGATERLLEQHGAFYLRKPPADKPSSFSFSSPIPKKIRHRTSTFSAHTQRVKDATAEELLPQQRTRHQTYSEESRPSHNVNRLRNLSAQPAIMMTRKPLELTLSLPPQTNPDFPELDINLRGAGEALTAPVRLDSGDGRRTFSFGGAMANRLQRKITRQMTISGDSSFSTVSTNVNMNRMLTRAISRTYTMNSVNDGSNSTILIDEWKPIFDKFDLEADGKQDGQIPLDKFAAILDHDPVWKESVPQSLKDKIIKEVDLNNDGVIDYREFLTLVKGRNLGLGKKRRRAFRQLLKETVEFLVPYKYTYQNEYSCSPPPLFMLIVSLLQVSIFVFNSYQQINDIGLNGPVPYCSNLIYNPNKTHQIWRYLTYSLVHAGLFHVSFNILVQLVLGIPLEMVHGGHRVGAVYLSGVLAGSLWTSIMKPGVFLSGASGGVYALIMGHLGTVIMNHREMSYPWWRVAVVTITALTDAGVYVYETAVLGQPAKPVSYPAHIAGALAGLLVGVVCLRNLSWERHQLYIWVFCLLTYAVLIIVSIVWNLVDNDNVNTHLKLDTECPHFIL